MQATRLVKTEKYGHQDKWLEIIDSSFLPDDLKTSYKELILARLKLITGHVF